MKRPASHGRHSVAPQIAFGILALVAIVVSLMFWFGDGLPKNEAGGKWQKDDRGVWVAVGTPGGEVPAEVRQQQFLINEAILAYNVAKESGLSLTDGPCLGAIFQDWVADIAHSPRLPADGMEENQCAALRNGEVSHFIELSPEGEILTIQ